MLQPIPSMLFLLPLVGLLLPATFPTSSNMAAAFSAFSTTSSSSKIAKILRQQRPSSSRHSSTTLANNKGSSLDPVTYLRTEWVSAALVANQTPRVADKVLQLGVGDGRIVNFVPRTVRYVNCQIIFMSWFTWSLQCVYCAPFHHLFIFRRSCVLSFSTFLYPHREIITSSAESKDGPEGGGLTVSAERQLKQMVSGITTCNILLLVRIIAINLSLSNSCQIINRRIDDKREHPSNIPTNQPTTSRTHPPRPWTLSFHFKPHNVCMTMD